ncbi:hypothetical protein [Anatilimnocola floriformis]|uniref:hypothetical protein n=1 Tax=Anatilimnocola floriformis TaxID=2948575 RepID=UPI0020C3FCE4|nr:hypothetical protein [Anatilimnocola floriformis]
MQRESHAPVIIGILLLLAALYVGSYFLLTVPQGVGLIKKNDDYQLEGNLEPYRIGGKFSAVIYWPLEQIDRNVRSKDWTLGDTARELKESIPDTNP